MKIIKITASWCPSCLIMNNMIDYARKHELSRIDLIATQEGYPIYKKLGFEDKAQKYTDMRLKVNNN